MADPTIIGGTALGVVGSGSGVLWVVGWGFLAVAATYAAYFLHPLRRAFSTGLVSLHLHPSLWVIPVVLAMASVTADWIPAWQEVGWAGTLATDALRPPIHAVGEAISAFVFHLWGPVALWPGGWVGVVLVMLIGWRGGRSAWLRGAGFFGALLTLALLAAHVIARTDPLFGAGWTGLGEGASDSPEGAMGLIGVASRAAEFLFAMLWAAWAMVLVTAGKRAVRRGAAISAAMGCAARFLPVAIGAALVEAVPSWIAPTSPEFAAIVRWSAVPVLLIIGALAVPMAAVRKGGAWWLGDDFIDALRLVYMRWAELLWFAIGGIPLVLMPIALAGACQRAGGDSVPLEVWSILGGALAAAFGAWVFASWCALLQLGAPKAPTVPRSPTARRFAR